MGAGVADPALGPKRGRKKGPDAQGPEMVRVSRERAEQEGMIGPGSRSRMSPRTTRVGGMAMVTTHRMTMTMEDTMLMSRLSMMTAKTVNHSPTVARTMGIEIQVLFTVE